MGVFSNNFQRARDLQAQATDDVWAYVCTSSSPPFAELMMWEPGCNHRILPWILWRYDLRGLLYYGCAFWAQQYEYDGLMVDADGTLDQTWGMKNGQFSGGGCLMYPGGRQITDTPQMSFRLELLRLGLQDYEYFWLLRDQVERKRGTWLDRRKARALLEVPDAIVPWPKPIDFTKDERKLEKHKRKIARMIEKLAGGD